MTERRGDDAKRDRLDIIEEKYDRFARRTLQILSVMAVVVLASAILNAYLLGQNSDRASEGVRLGLEIQQSQRDTILTSCRETNSRNGQAYIFLSHLPASPGQPKRTAKEQNRLIHGFTDALVGPVRDCRRRADQLIR